METKQYLSLKETGKQIEVHWRTVYNWIKQGKIKALKIGSYWKVEQATIDELKQCK